MKTPTWISFSGNGRVEVGRVWSREEVSQKVIFKILFNKQSIYIKLKVTLFYW